MWMTIGVVLFVAVLVFLRDHRRLQAFTYTSGLAAIALLLLPLVPGIGKNINGARIWIGIGPMSFQPGEVAKVLLVIAFAGYLVQHRDALALAGRRVLFVDLPRGRDLGPILAVWLISLGILVFQNDLGSSLLFFGLFLVMLYVATERPGWLVVGTLMFSVGAYVGYLFVGQVKVRVEGWLDPFGNVDSASQLIQGMYGMAWGGLVGRGLGQGSPYLTPLSFSDFILPSLGEELGLTGVMAIVLLYGLIVERSLRTALVCRDGFGKLVATGLGVVFAIQVFVVIGGVTRLIPLTGPHHALPVVRRVVAGRELGDHRAAPAHLRPGPAAHHRSCSPPTTTPTRPRWSRSDESPHEAARCAHASAGAPMNKPIRNLSVFCMLLFVALLANATFLQYWQADDLSSLSAHPDNRRVRDLQFSRERGAILVQGKAIAQSVKSKDRYKFQRVYPTGPQYAQVTGYFSRDFGLGGIEANQDSILSGSDSSLFVNRVIDLFGNDEPKGGNVTVTINPKAQKAAFDGLRKLGTNVKGAVVAIEPATGKILAMVSSPTYDPNKLATHDFAAAGRTKARLQSSPDGPLQNRAIEETLPPGSTFKVVTSSAALDKSRFTPDSRVPGGRILDVTNGRPVQNENGASCGGGTITLARALEVSCNVAFAWLGLKVGEKGHAGPVRRVRLRRPVLHRARRLPDQAGDQPLLRPAAGQ
jgi:cell division protein FtsW (lipid II flippase)